MADFLPLTSSLSTTVIMIFLIEEIIKILGARIIIF